jgi:NADPH-dependent 2,4-dienoyl-CoA reductase/sulfur reductase-like enzyme
MNHLLSIGGNDAGMSAACRAREVAPDRRVTRVVADAYPNVSICGLPYYVSGEVPDWRNLAHRTRADIEALLGIVLSLDHIDPVAKLITVRNRDGAATDLAYNRLVIGVGATPQRPGSTVSTKMLLHTIAVPAQYTSQDCSGCGERVPKSLSIRTHICPACGLVMDRDENAALNIQRAGQTLRGYPGLLG